MRKYNRYQIAFIMILGIQVLFLIYFGFRKQNLHLDEYFSYYSTSDHDFYIGLADGDWNESDIMIKKCMVDPGEGFNYWNVYVMESKDVHPPLYYFCLHTICSLFPGSFTKWTGLGLNILFFIISSLLLGRITWLLTDENWALTLAVNLFYGFNPAVISEVMFIRMYMLLTVFLFLFAYLHLRIEKMQYRMTKKECWYIAAVSFGGFLTHYYFIIFAGILSALFAVRLLLEYKKRKEMISCFGSFVFGICLAVVFYPASILHIFFGYRGEGAQKALFDLGNTGYRLQYFLQLTSRIAFDNKLAEIFIFVTLGVVIALGVGLYSDRQIRSKLYAQIRDLGPLFISMAGYYLLAAKTALLGEDEMVRYTLPVYGFLFLFLIYLIYKSLGILIRNRKIRGISLALLMSGGLALNFWGLKNGKVLFLYPESVQRVAFAESHKNDPVLLIHGPGGWMWEIEKELEEYPKFYSESWEKLELIEDKKVREADRLVAYIDHTEEDKQQESIDIVMESNEKLKNYEIFFKTQYYTVYLFY